MKYVFDNYALQYMLEQFPRKVMKKEWISFEQQCSNGTIISEKQVLLILESEATEISTLDWIKRNDNIFKSISGRESIILGEMIDKGIFDFYNEPHLAVRKLPESIPFILSIAKNQNCIFVYRKNSKYLKTILDICENEQIKKMEIEEYILMTQS